MKSCMTRKRRRPGSPSQRQDARVATLVTMPGPRHSRLQAKNKAKQTREATQRTTRNMLKLARPSSSQCSPSARRHGRQTQRTHQDTERQRQRAPPPRGAQRGGVFSAARSLTHTSNDIGRVTNAHRTIQHHTRAGQPACTTCTGDRRGVRLRREHDDGTRQSDRDRTDSDHSHTDAALLLAGKRGCDPLGRAGLEQLCSRHACWASVENRLSVERGVGTYQRKTA